VHEADDEPFVSTLFGPGRAVEVPSTGGGGVSARRNSRAVEEEGPPDAESLLFNLHPLDWIFVYNQSNPAQALDASRYSGAGLAVVHCRWLTEDDERISTVAVTSEEDCVALDHNATRREGVARRGPHRLNTQGASLLAYVDDDACVTVEEDLDGGDEEVASPLSPVPLPRAPHHYRSLSAGDAAYGAGGIGRQPVLTSSSAVPVDGRLPAAPPASGATLSDPHYCGADLCHSHVLEIDVWERGTVASAALRDRLVSIVRGSLVDLVMEMYVLGQPGASAHSRRGG